MGCSGLLAATNSPPVGGGEWEREGERQRERGRKRARERERENDRER